MRFSNVCIESIATALPEEILSSAEIERRLKPLYERLKLPEGRVEHMTGIRERRIWPVGTRPSDASAAAGKAVLAKSKLTADQVELYIHSAVSRDMVEPATASFAHRKIGLPEKAQIFDVSNACLGFLNSITIAASMIESGQIRCALISAGENSRPLVDATLKMLNERELSRQELKPFLANLTVGSGAVAAMICHRDLVSGHAHRLIGGVAQAATIHSELCQGDTHGADALAMQTDSAQLLAAGVALGHATWTRFKADLGWDADSTNCFICHQISATHRRKMFEMLGLDLAKDFSTFETLGNTGSVALPATLSAAVDAGFVKDGSRVALLGIGSGLNCMMLGLEW